MLGARARGGARDRLAHRRKTRAEFEAMQLPVHFQGMPEQLAVSVEVQAAADARARAGDDALISPATDLTWTSALIESNAHHRILRRRPVLLRDAPRHFVGWP